MLVLVTILSFATPGVSWSAARELSPMATSSMSLAAPASGSLIVRATAAKTDKTSFGFGFAIAADHPALFPPGGAIVDAPFYTSDAPNLDLSNPPLAPRPPPSC